MNVATAIEAASAALAIVSTIGSFLASRLRAWKQIAQTEAKTNQDLRDQIRDLRTVALIDERIARLRQDDHDPKH